MPSVPRITGVERITLDVPFRERIHAWNMLLVRQWRVVEILRVTTDAPDIVGWGETLPHYTWGAVTDEAIARVTGGNPAEFLGDDSLGAGLQMALYDIVGKALGVPVHRLFNLPQVRTHCPIAWWNTKMPPEVLAEEAKEAVARGYLAHKMKARPWFDVYAQVDAISDVTPASYRIELDWNDMLLNVGNAAPVLRELDKRERVALYEGPIPQRDVEGYRLLRRKSGRPIAMHFGLPPFDIAVREEMCDGFVVFGGISNILRQGTLAGAFEKPFFLQMVGAGLTTALMSHLAAVLPFAQWPAVTCMHNYTEDLLNEPLIVRGGYLQTPEGIGLGVTVSEAALDRYRMEPPYSIPPERQIVSVVWPGDRVVQYAALHHERLEAGVHYSHLQHAESRPRLDRTQVWEDFLAGNQPVQERGVRMEVRPDDGTAEWATLYREVLRGPVRT